MIRVGIEFPFNDLNWIGGVNGIANLLRALKTLPDPRIEVVLVAGQGTPDALIAQLPPVPVLRTGWVDRAARKYLVRRISKRLIGLDIPMDRWLQAHGIDVFSHADPLGRRARTAAIGQIADFGFIRMKDLYSKEQFERQFAGTRRVVNQLDVVMMPSFTVAADYKHFFPGAHALAAPLQIIPSQPASSADPAELDRVKSLYSLPDRYFYLPNQFWVHKNHRVVVEAMTLLNRRGDCPHVVLTGQTADPRQPVYFEELMQIVRERGLADRFHVLGLIPFPDTVTLMQNCIAVISASRFEGWGLTVAEARMLGKTVILSDIPVFREQAPERGLFFGVDDAETLARHMTAVAADYSPDVDSERRREAEARRPELIRDYARGYEEIVLRATAMKRTTRRRLQPQPSTPLTNVSSG